MFDKLGHVQSNAAAGVQVAGTLEPTGSKSVYQVMGTSGVAHLEYAILKMPEQTVTVVRYLLGASPYQGEEGWRCGMPLVGKQQYGGGFHLGSAEDCLSVPGVYLLLHLALLAPLTQHFTFVQGTNTASQ